MAFLQQASFRQAASSSRLNLLISETPIFYRRTLGFLPSALKLLLILRKWLSGILDCLQRHLGPLPANDFKLLVLKLVRGDEEFLQLFPDGLRKLPYVMKTPLRVRAPGHCKQAVVSFSVAFTFLLDLENADDAAG